MKKWFLVFLLFPMVVNAQVTTPSFTIEGKLEGYPEGTDILLYKNGENIETARTKLLNDKFTVHGSVKEPMLCFLIVGTDKPVEIFVENTTISVKGKKSEPTEYKIEGSNSHKEFSSFIEAFIPLAKQSNSLASTINATPAGDERDRLSALYKTSQDKIQQAIDKFVKDKPKSYVSAFILSVTYSFKEDVMAYKNPELKLSSFLILSSLVSGLTRNIKSS